MNDAPGWLVNTWLVVSTITFVLSLVLNFVLIFVALKLWGKVGPLLDDLRKEIKVISDKVNGITTSAKTTVDTVSARTSQIMGSAEEASSNVASKVSAASAAITAIFVVTRIVGALRGMNADKVAPAGKVRKFRLPG
jgi:predicted PurR-regulated permease PerM